MHNTYSAHLIHFDFNTQITLCNEATFYLITSNLLLPPVYHVQTFISALCSQKPQVFSSLE